MHRDDLAFSKFCFLTFLWKFSFIVSISRCPLQPPHNLGDGSETEICCKILWKAATYWKDCGPVQIQLSMCMCFVSCRWRKFHWSNTVVVNVKNNRWAQMSFVVIIMGAF